MIVEEIDYETAIKTKEQRNAMKEVLKVLHNNETDIICIVRK